MPMAPAINPYAWIPFQTMCPAAPAPMCPPAALPRAVVGNLMQSLSGLLGQLGQLFRQIGALGLQAAPAAGGNTRQAPASGGQSPAMSAPAACLCKHLPAPTSGSPITRSPAASTSMDRDSALSELARFFDDIKPCGGFIDKQDLRTIANGGSPGHMKGGPTPELQAAASYLLAHPEAFDELDTADRNAQGRVGHRDGRVGRSDVNAALQRTGFGIGEKEAVQTLVRHFDALKAGKGFIDLGELKQIAKTGTMPNGKPAPADLLKAAQAVASHPALANKLDNAAGIRSGRADQRSDGQISKDDLNETLSGPQTTVKPHRSSMAHGEHLVMGNDGKLGASLEALIKRNDVDTQAMARPPIVGH